MKTTELIIKVIIKHDTDSCKQEAMNMLCDGIKEGFTIKGMNGNGEQFDLKVTEIIDSKETIVTKSEDKGLVYGGKIAHLPIEIVERMLIEQELQGNSRNVSVFEEFSGTNRSSGGFNWYQDNDGEMWNDIFSSNDYTKFYEKYPKTK